MMDKSKLIKKNEILTIVNEKKLARANIELGYKNYLSKRLEDLFTKYLKVLVSQWYKLAVSVHQWPKVNIHS